MNYGRSACRNRANAAILDSGKALALQSGMTKCPYGCEEFVDSDSRCDSCQAPPVTADAWMARMSAERGAGWLSELARASHDPTAAAPWVVLAWHHSAGYRAIVAGYNRLTGQPICWRVPSFDSEDYDVSNAVEVTK